MYHGIHTENEQFYQEAQKALHTCHSRKSLEFDTIVGKVWNLIPAGLKAACTKQIM